jgi:hypothetical protein
MLHGLSHNNPDKNCGQPRLVSFPDVSYNLPRRRQVAMRAGLRKSMSLWRVPHKSK